MTFTDSNFQTEVLESDVPVLVDFWGPWCRPCHALAPTIEKLAESANGYKVGKVNIDENPTTTARFGVNAVPTVILFVKGQVSERWVGLKTESVYRSALERING